MGWSQGLLMTGWSWLWLRVILILLFKVAVRLWIEMWSSYSEQALFPEVEDTSSTLDSLSSQMKPLIVIRSHTCSDVNLLCFAPIWGRMWENSDHWIWNNIQVLVKHCTLCCVSNYRVAGNVGAEGTLGSSGTKRLIYNVSVRSVRCAVWTQWKCVLMQVLHRERAKANEFQLEKYLIIQFFFF